MYELFLQRVAEPGPRVLPVSVGDRPRDPQRRARLLNGKPAEQVEVGNLRRRGVFRSESGD